MKDAKVYLSKIVVKVEASRDWLWMGDGIATAEIEAASARKALGVPVAIERWGYEYTKTGHRIVEKRRLTTLT